MAKTLPHPRSLPAVAARLMALREASDLNQSQFSLRVGIASNAWNNYETQDTRISLEMAFRLVDALGITLDWIYLGDPKSMPYDLMLKIQATLPGAFAKVA